MKMRYHWRTYELKANAPQSFTIVNFSYPQDTDVETLLRNYCRC
jgi:hypothetical protein